MWTESLQGRGARPFPWMRRPQRAGPRPGEAGSALPPRVGSALRLDRRWDKPDGFGGGPGGPRSHGVHWLPLNVLDGTFCPQLRGPGEAPAGPSAPWAPRAACHPNRPRASVYTPR